MTDAELDEKALEALGRSISGIRHLLLGYPLDRERAEKFLADALEVFNALKVRICSKS